jgi:SAM-dependent methyltransferase
MGLETSKANRRRVHDPFWQRVFVGDGIDIGAGDDPLMREGHWPAVRSCRDFDVNDGDANSIGEYCPRESYDFVYSSHCLEHMRAPEQALHEWWALVKPRGHLVVVVPDEDLYEQGHWPSRHNGDHKWTFTIHKPQGAGGSWSPQSINVFSLIVENLTSFRLLSLRIVDTGYNYELRGVDQTAHGAEAAIEFVVQKMAQ